MAPTKEKARGDGAERDLVVLAVKVGRDVVPSQGTAMPSREYGCPAETGAGWGQTLPQCPQKEGSLGIALISAQQFGLLAPRTMRDCCKPLSL